MLITSQLRQLAEILEELATERDPFDPGMLNVLLAAKGMKIVSIAEANRPQLALADVTPVAPPPPPEPVAPLIPERPRTVSPMTHPLLSNNEKVIIEAQERMANAFQHKKRLIFTPENILQLIRIIRRIGTAVPPDQQ